MILQRTKNCPRARRNLTLDHDQIPLYLNSSLDFNLTFYFNCTDSVPDTYPIDCLRSGYNMSYVSLSGYEMVDLPWYGFCEDKVGATVMATLVAMNNAWVSSFGRIMNKGFALAWSRTEDCTKCERSDGRCGFSNQNNEFFCFCSDGTISFDSCKKGTAIFVPKFFDYTVFSIDSCS